MGRPRLSEEEKAKRLAEKEKIKAFNNYKKEFIIKHVTNGEINWPRELGIVNKLFKKVESIEFWKQFEFTTFKLNSLAYLLGANGLIIIEEAYKKFVNDKKINNIALPVKKIYNFGNDKCGEDYVAPKKLKSLKEFLNS